MFKDGQARQAGWYLVQDGEDALSAGRKRLRSRVCLDRRDISCNGYIYALSHIDLDHSRRRNEPVDWYICSSHNRLGFDLCSSCKKIISCVFASPEMDDLLLTKSMRKLVEVRSADSSNGRIQEKKEINDLSSLNNTPAIHTLLWYVYDMHFLITILNS